MAATVNVYPYKELSVMYFSLGKSVRAVPPHGWHLASENIAQSVAALGSLYSCGLNHERLFNFDR